MYRNCKMFPLFLFLSFHQKGLLAVQFCSGKWWHFTVTLRTTATQHWQNGWAGLTSLQTIATNINNTQKIYYLFKSCWARENFSCSSVLLPRIDSNLAKLENHYHAGWVSGIQSSWMIQRGITQNSWLWSVAAGSSWVVSILNLVFQT